jgi:arginyl-tRNA synthetase
MLDIEKELKKQIVKSIEDLYQIQFEDIAVEIPPRIEFGDIALTFAFELAQRLKQTTGQKWNPRRIAESILAILEKPEGVDKIEIAGPGYVNVFLDRAEYLLSLEKELGKLPVPDQSSREKIIVEHTALNPNKAAHIGHLRNAVLGDTLVRLLRAVGEQVEVHNYIDNTGVQVADVVVGFKYLEKKTLDEISQIAGKFDDYCWDLYARVTRWYEQNSSNLEYRRQTLQEMEIEGHPTAELADYIATRVLNCHLNTMDRLGIRYDLLPRESDILHLYFWERAFEMLKQKGVAVYEKEGYYKGCWVIKTQALEKPDQNDSYLPDDDASESGINGQEHEMDKVLVRSDGTVLYTGKDMAYHLWKMGKLGVDFDYRMFRLYPDGHRTWVSTNGLTEGVEATHPSFGLGSAYLNVIGVEQTYLQDYVKRAIAELVPEADISRCAHVSYEKVALSPQACLELGIRLTPDEMQRQQISMSGRRGLGVKADDFINRLEERAIEEVRSRHDNLSDAEQLGLARKIAVGALRYFLLKYTRTSSIIFDFQEALSFEGETGPYIQYAVVRANSIFRKLGMDNTKQDCAASIPKTQLYEMLHSKNSNDLWASIYLAGRLKQTVKQACDNLEPAIIGRYAFQLAQQFNTFYHNHHILGETDQARQMLLIAITAIVEHQLRYVLSLMGIEVPERM